MVIDCVCGPVIFYYINDLIFFAKKDICYIVFSSIQIVGKYFISIKSYSVFKEFFTYHVIVFIICNQSQPNPHASAGNKYAMILKCIGFFCKFWTVNNVTLLYYV